VSDEELEIGMLRLYIPTN